MSPELQVIIGSFVGGSGALLSYWAGWNARDACRPPTGSYGPRLTEPPTRRGNRRGSNPPPPGTKPKPPAGRLIGPGGVPIGYQPRPQQGTPNPPPSEP